MAERNTVMNKLLFRTYSLLFLTFMTLLSATYATVLSPAQPPPLPYPDIFVVDLRGKNVQTLPVPKDFNGAVWVEISLPQDLRDGIAPSLPHKTDYYKWAEFFCERRKEDTRLKTWYMKDFHWNRTDIKPDELRKIAETLNSCGMELWVDVPAKTVPNFLEKYAGSFHGLTFSVNPIREGVLKRETVQTAGRSCKKLGIPSMLRLITEEKQRKGKLVLTEEVVEFAFTLSSYYSSGILLDPLPDALKEFFSRKVRKLQLMRKYARNSVL